MLFNNETLTVATGIHDAGVLQEIYDEYLQSLRQLLDALDTGEMNQHNLRMEVHKLKSSSASVGATALSEILILLEHDLVAGKNCADQIRQARVIGQQTLDAISSYLQKR